MTFSALHDALIHNQILVVITLLKACNSKTEKRWAEFINAKNHLQQSPLHIAVLKKQKEAIALLLANGADPHLTDFNGNSAFHVAADDRSDCLKLLLDPLIGQTPTIRAKFNERNYAGILFNKLFYYIVEILFILRVIIAQLFLRFQDSFLYTLP